MGEGIVLGIRHPISRFASAFNSRKRKGRPRNNIEWTPAQRIGFQRFASPNDLAEALYSDDVADQKFAHAHMKAVPHLARNLGFWLGTAKAVEARRPDILAIIAQENFASDFERMRQRLKLSDSCRLPDNDVEAHRAPNRSDTALTDLAIANLTRWYEADISLYEFLRDLSKQQQLEA